jgi:DNA-binding PadR family transcriptional regulator
MAATQTRLLVLGAVSLFEPVNGYQIRRELMSWEVDRWAHINPGSIYSCLTTMTKQGLLHRHDVVDGSRDVAVYVTTEAGRTELTEMFGVALETVEVLDPLPLHTALSMCPLFSRDVVARHLERRVTGLEAHLADLRDKHGETVAGSAPPHVARVVELQLGSTGVELEWARRLLADIRAGELWFAGEPMGWRPADDDPGWQMAAERDRYRSMLATGDATS